MGQQVIGASLSKCVFDIVAGHVALEDVDTIFSRTAAENDDVWDVVLDEYGRTAWWSGKTDVEALDFSNQCTQLARQLIKMNKVVQPRLQQGFRAVSEGLNRQASHWFDAATKEPVVSKTFEGTARGTEFARMAGTVLSL